MVASLDVCPTEDAIQVFLQHLVDPFLPEKSSVRDNPTLPQQQSMAKQVHSVVLLYNYYHRKQHPELEYLPFNEFCKLIVVLRPPLLAYMQFMQKLNDVELIDVEKQLSLTEKVIMDACDDCKCLDASKNVPNIEGWLISKVAILLIDSKKENCFLLFDSITSGVWSVVEKSVDTSSQNSVVTSGKEHAHKRKRIIRKATKDESKVDEDRLLQVGYSAVKEATGINNTDIMLLASYTVYSQSKEKAASRFFIMQCSQSINQEVIKIPLEDVVESLKGPLVEKSSSSWTITPAMVYFHVLPYSEIISQCISRKEFSNSLQDSRKIEKSLMVDSPAMVEPYISKDMYSDIDSKPSKENIESLEQKENNGSCALVVHNSIKETREMDVDKSSIYPSQIKEECQNIVNTIQIGEDQGKNNPSVQCNSNAIKETRAMDVNKSSIYPSQIKEKCQNIVTTIQVGEDRQKNNPSVQCNSNAIKETRAMDVNQSSIYPSQIKEKCQNIVNTIQIGEDQEKNNPSVQCNSNDCASDTQAMETDSTRMLNNKVGANNIASSSKLCANRPNTSFEKDTRDASTPSSNHSNSDAQKLQSLKDSKKKLSQTALTSLIRKRSKLALQQRKIEDEIAICDEKIQRLLTDGKDDFESMIECIIEGCNDESVANQERMGGQESFPLKRRSLYEAQSSCQDLDGVCHDKN